MIVEKDPMPTFVNRLLLIKPVFWFFIGCLLLSYLVGQVVEPRWLVEKTAVEARVDAQMGLVADVGDQLLSLASVVPHHQSSLHPLNIDKTISSGEIHRVDAQVVYELARVGSQEVHKYYLLRAKRHWQLWSMFPAIVAIVLCWLTREPITSLFGGIICGALILAKYDITDQILVPTLTTYHSAGIIVLYLWLLAGLLGIWSRTGAAQAFAYWVTTHVVRGPKSGKLMTWILGLIFFQGGSISTVLTGTTVKPITDKENLSHEELAFVVDGMASPVASQLALNAWPGYIQGFMMVAGVSFLATVDARQSFYFKSIPLCFYSIAMILITLLFCFELYPFLGKRMRRAISRSRESGRLDGPDAEPLASAHLFKAHVPPGYVPSMWEFIVPLMVLISVVVSTHVLQGEPHVRWAFFLAILVAIAMALAKGMSLREIMDGVGDGVRGVAVGTFILLLAITIGGISKEAGGPLFLVDQIGSNLPFWSLPIIFQLLAMFISFTSGTSWGTYAVVLPLAMPLSLAVAQASGFADIEFFMLLCFAAVIDGGVWGDQCSPISDTSVLTSITTGCDLMDHIKSQLPICLPPAVLAAILWTVLVILGKG